MTPVYIIKPIRVFIVSKYSTIGFHYPVPLVLADEKLKVGGAVKDSVPKLKVKG